MDWFNEDFVKFCVHCGSQLTPAQKDTDLQGRPILWRNCTGCNVIIGPKPV